MNPPHDSLLRIAVVGHTNTGKTSLLRTLIRDRSFGMVGDRAGVTREVEGTALLVRGQPIATLFDTPGLEDPIGLWDALSEFRGDDREEGPDIIQRFLHSDIAVEDFSQEAKAIRQLLDCHLALYVIDARDRVLGKHRDELRVFTLCGRPMLPVLNFVASTEARCREWREHLSRSGLHAVAEFDTVVVTEEGETQLFEKMRTLLDGYRRELDALVRDRKLLRQRLVQVSLRRIAELLVQLSAIRLNVMIQSPEASGWKVSNWLKASNPQLVDSRSVEKLRNTVRDLEQRCVNDLLEWHRFHAEDCVTTGFPLDEGRWGLDLFDPEVLKHFGATTSSGAAAGAMAGMMVDVAVGGLSLGMGTLTGATVGALLGLGRSQGRRLLQTLQGRTELSCQEATLHLVAARQIHLLKSLLARGHASQNPVQLPGAEEGTEVWQALTSFSKGLPKPMRRARAHPAWSHPPVPWGGVMMEDSSREEAIDELASLLEMDLQGRENNL